MLYPQTAAFEEAAQTVLDRCDLCATFSEEPGRVTRRFATPPMHRVHEALTSWLRAAGLTVEIDAIGNLSLTTRRIGLTHRRCCWGRTWIRCVMLASTMVLLGVLVALCLPGTPGRARGTPALSPRAGGLCR